MKAHDPATIDRPTLIALKKLGDGVANEGEQKLALDWIVRRAALAHHVSYQPGDPTGTAFAEGRRFVGLQVLEALLPATMKRLDESGRDWIEIFKL